METALVQLLFILDYVSILGKLVASRYANGLYRQYMTGEDGKLYNVSGGFRVIIYILGKIILYIGRMRWWLGVVTTCPLAI